MPPRHLLLCAGVAALALTLGCDKKAKKPDETKPAAPAIKRRADSGPLLTRQTGALTSKTTPLKLQALARGKIGAREVVFALAPNQTNTQLTAAVNLMGASMRVEGGRAFTGRRWNGINAQLAAALGKKPHELEGAVIVAALDRAPGDALTITAEAPGGLNYRGTLEAGHVYAITIEGASKAPAIPNADELYLGVASQWFKEREVRLRASEPFFTFANARLQQLASAKLAARTPNAQPQQRPRRTGVGQTMALYTGMTSVEEALQHDRGLLLRGAAQQPTIALSTLKGPPLPSHPWPEMIKALGKQPVIEPMAAQIPEDMLYFHAHDLRTVVRLAREADELITPAARALEERGGEAHFTEAYERQLAIERSVLSEQLGHVAVSAFALTTSDPFVREGGDISLLFKMRNPQLIRTQLDQYAAAAVKRRPDARATTITVEGVQAALLSTPDRDIYQIRMELGDLLILTNSQAAAASFVRVHNKKAPALSARGDFQYMRALYPFDPKAEDGFIFIGDTFVHHAIGPRAKVLASRRVEAKADLLAVNYAALLYGWMEGRPAKTIDEVVQAGYLKVEELKHSDGQAISYDPRHGAVSAWGRPAQLAPMADQQVNMITQAEADAYKRFAETYQSNWRGFIDPIAARIRRSADGKRLEVDARMLPLIDGTEYRDLLRRVGTTRFMPGTVGGSMQWTFAVGQDSRLRRELSRMGQQMSGRRDITLDWLGDWVTVGAEDRSGLWDLELAVGNMPETAPRDQPGMLSPNARRLIQRIPGFIMLDVRDGLALAATLSGLRKYVEDTAPGMVSWGNTPMTYRDTPIVVITESQNSPVQEPDRLRILYTTVKGKLIIALEQETIEAQMDAVLDGRVPTGAPALGELPEVGTAARQTSVSFAPWQDGWLIPTLLLAQEGVQVRNTRAAMLVYEALHEGLGSVPDDEDARRALGRAHLGYAPSVIHGAPVTRDTSGHLTHTHYGSHLNPKLPKLPVPGSPLTALLQSTRDLDVAVSFEGKGQHQGLHTSLVWTKR